ncbi:tRNA pseudouridine38-40 synthase [Marchantia polymorpha subsp. ruderalis]|uniref:Pseudouridine synthase I TruA alpha/beta domain-containing protein n=2 Tax=Marchantia polymorpha TaxID=3197 RepID=A0AAF6BXB9_MARPO|nr:hypothetical protein MARPO_0146s0022 [Marchantia polymorpha]BBN16653.1 hypothetical protein Mp_7g08220 [Marchantia polymorpha subsp. ruderalis]|eukprot:PTQ29200.1 hypothetical protein MARPO_0146s0022 [Marchantia polymorpha]
MIAQRLRCGVPVGITRCPTICRMCSTQLPCQIDGRIISRICGRQDVISSRKDWFCPSVDGLWGRDGRRDALPELGSKKLGKLIKGNWSCAPSCVGRHEFREFSIQSIANSKPNWAVTAPGRAGSAGLRASAVRGSARTDAGVELEVEDRAQFMRKKKVALWVGYVGTDYKGLQIVRGSDSVKTIEGELEKAIFKAGGILESNYGSLEKVSWSRSSRTDKGVHSLATVITMKMELPPTAWISDTDGLQLAESINIHLPSTIRVFGVVPVTKSFDARRFCCTRTYNYLLPADLIEIGEDTPPEVVGQRIEEFRQILNQFVGRFPFHNFTQRRLYRSSTLNAKSSWGKNNSRRRSPFPVKTEVVAGTEGDGLDEDADQPEAEEKIPDVNSTLLSDMLDVKAYWLSSPNLADKLGPSHFRRILECSCGGLEVSNGVRFVRISITGESFMVHQIRKMVATAVGVARGLLPRDIISLSLCRHTRVILPLAPSEGLLLARNSFYPFRQLLAPASERAFRESDVGVERLKELPKLHMSNRIEENVDVFWRNVLLPRMTPLLDESLPHWSFFLKNLELQGFIGEAEIAEVRTKWTNWREESRLKMEAEMAAGKLTSEVDDDILPEGVPEVENRSTETGSQS